MMAPVAQSGEKWGTTSDQSPSADDRTGTPGPPRHQGRARGHAAAGPSKPRNLRPGVTRSVFTGEYRHTVDDKGRIAVPSKFRAQLDGGAVVSRWIDGCLAIHTSDRLGTLADKIAALPVTDASARLFGRSVFAGATEADLDRQGRVLLPAYLREGIGLDDRGASSSARVTTPRSGPRPRGRSTAGRWTTRRPSPRPSRASGSRSHHMRIQDPLRIRRRSAVARCGTGMCRCWRRRS